MYLCGSRFETLIPKPSPAAARALQHRMAPQVVRKNGFGKIEAVAGIDVGFPDGGKTTRAAVVVMDALAETVIDSAVIEQPTVMPYIPGLLSFREVPAMLQALAKLTIQPDLILVDGQGIAHPRRCGSACHLGLACGLPAIGVGKSRLCGSHSGLPEARGSIVDLRDGGELIGKVVRTRRQTNPLFVSVGHRVHLRTAVRIVLQTTWRYRLPEPIWEADRLASR